MWAFLQLWCTGFLLQWCPLLWSMGSRSLGLLQVQPMGSVVAAPRFYSTGTDSTDGHGLYSGPEACGLFWDQGRNPCLLHWQPDSLSLSHRGSLLIFIFSFYLLSHLWLTQWQLHPGNGLSPWLPKPSTILVLHYLPGYFLSVFLTGIVSF